MSGIKNQLCTKTTQQEVLISDKETGQNQGLTENKKASTKFYLSQNLRRNHLIY